MADILIRGMEMPDGCHNCRFSYFDKGETNDGEPCTVLMCSAMNQGTNGAEYDGNRPFWCPLVPLPEGHGRLGDLDRIESFLQTLALYQSGERQQGILGCCETIKATKAVVPAEGENG